MKTPQARHNKEPTVFHVDALFRWHVQHHFDAENICLPCHLVRHLVLYLPMRSMLLYDGQGNISGWFSVFFLFSLSCHWKITSVLHVCESFILVPILLILILVLISSIEILIVFNCVLQLKMIIHIGSHFTPYPFNLCFVFCSFIFFGMQILICFNFIFQFKLVINATFNFSPYSLKFFTQLHCN